MMKLLSYVYCCTYYYTRQITETGSLLLAVLMGCFAIHKLVGWAIWVMSL